MTISSRTPEGEPNHCAVCGKAINLEPSMPFGDAPCPYCGVLLWFVFSGSTIRFFEYDEAAPVRDRVRHLLAKKLGVSVEKITVDSLSDVDFKTLGVDSLDIVELVMESEEEYYSH